MYRTKIRFHIYSPFCTLPPQPRFPLEGNDPGNHDDFAEDFPLLPISKGESEGVPYERGG